MMDLTFQNREIYLEGRKSDCMEVRFHLIYVHILLLLVLINSHVFHPLAFRLHLLNSLISLVQE